MVTAMSGPFRHLATLTLLALCTWLQAVEDVELFVLDDGRELVGTYDETAGKLSVLTPNGYIVVDVAKERIGRRKPAVIPDYGAASGVAEGAAQAAVAPVMAMPRPVAKAPTPPAAVPQKGGPDGTQLMDFARQFIQLQQAAAAGDPVAAKQLQQLQQLRQQVEGQLEQRNRNRRSER